MKLSKISSATGCVIARDARPVGVSWRRWAAAAVVVAGLATLGSAEAMAQGGSAPSTYQPSRPTVSPWMGLFQRNSGALDNYHTYVRPDVRLQGTLRQQEQKIEIQEDITNRMTGDGLAQPNRGITRPTGSGSLFMDYSHYYDMKDATIRGPVNRPPRPGGRAGS